MAAAPKDVKNDTKEVKETPKEVKEAPKEVKRRSGIIVSESDKELLSVRRELNQRQIEVLKARAKDPAESLAAYSREDLEGEIKTLRRELQDIEKRMLENQLFVRDILSHEMTGKDLDYLQLNQTQEKPQKKQDMGKLLEEAAKRALGGGLPGALAMAAQVTLLMWIRTVMNYQYRHGMQTMEAMRTLYAQGGLPRFYRGYMPALLQGPLARFGDTAANSGVLSLMDNMDSTKNWPVSVKTLFASGAAAGYRILLMPVDTVKTIMQVEGQQGFSILTAKMKKSGPSTLFHGAIGASVATFVGHYPWFFTFNYLNENLPHAPKDDMWAKLGRNALIGFCSSAVSDTISNSLRVIKTTKQTAEHSVSYRQATQMVIDKDGIQGLFGRGLKTRIIANGLQGMLFTIIWKGLEDKWKEMEKAKAAAGKK